MRSTVRRLISFVLFAFLLTFLIECTPIKAPSGGTVHIISSSSAFPYDTLAHAVSAVGPNDEIHILNTHPYEQLQNDLVISTDNLWIIGSEPQLYGVPTIDLNGHSIVVSGSSVVIMGLNITDFSSLPTQIGVKITGAHSLFTMNYVLVQPFPGSVGIEVTSSISEPGFNSDISFNTIIGWDTGIVLNAATANLVVGNTLSAYGVAGIELRNGSIYNLVYLNNLLAPNELLDNCQPYNGPNSFDDSHFNLNKGNYEVTNGGSGPYNVPGPNGYVDNYPLTSPSTRITGDFASQYGVVGLTDLVTLCRAYGTSWPNSLLWNSICDISPPWGIIGLGDLVILANHYGEVYP